MAGSARKRMSMATIAVGRSSRPRPARARPGEICRRGVIVEVFTLAGRHRRRGIDTRNRKLVKISGAMSIRRRR
jgi:hypothetical protein